MWPFVYGFFHLAQCFQGLCRLWIHQYTFLFTTKEYPSMCIYYIFFIHSLVDRHLDCSPYFLLISCASDVFNLSLIPYLNSFMISSKVTSIKLSLVPLPSSTCLNLLIMKYFELRKVYVQHPVIYPKIFTFGHICFRSHF